jgi:hypothetical protein
MSFLLKNIWDGLSVPKGYFVLGRLCLKDRSVAGTLQPGTFCPGTFRQGTEFNICMFAFTASHLKLHASFEERPAGEQSAFAELFCT